MYIPKVRLAPSLIDGIGVFTNEEISRDTVVWRYEPAHDLAFSLDQAARMTSKERAELEHSAYLSPWSNLWICPPDGDPACYTNHSSDNNLSVRFDPSVSSEPFFIANRTIRAGEELTNNYHEFDAMTRQHDPKWARQ